MTASRTTGWRDRAGAVVQHIGAAVAIALWFGFVAGWLEAAQHYWFRHDPGILTIHKVSPHIFWIAPVVTAGLTGLTAAAGALPVAVVRSWPSVGMALLSSVWLGVYGLATLTNKVHKAAAAVLALGVAVALWRRLRHRPTHFFVKTLPLLAAAVLFISIGLRTATARTELSWIAELSPPRPGAPNVVVIVLDTVRADHLSLDGYRRETTPNIDRWAASGVVFDAAWSSTSWTLPAHASLLTGRAAYQHGADRNARLDDRYPLLPEYLRAHGYMTGAFVANNIWINPGYGFDRGFQRFKVHTPYSDAARTVWGRKAEASLRDWFGFRPVPVRKSAAWVNAELLEWIDHAPRRPFFALLNYFDAHDPYEPQAPFDTRFTGEGPDTRKEKQPYQRAINAYDGLLAYLDTQVEALRLALEQRGLAENTIVILTADHGESLGDHGQPQHGRNLHRPVLRVPLILLAPGMPGSERVPTAVSIEQIPATVVDLLGLASGSPFPGESLARMFSRGADSEPVLAELKRVGGALAAKSLLNSQWQYIWNAPDGHEELYDLVRDPLELANQIDSPDAEPQLRVFRRRLQALFPDLGIGHKPPAGGVVADRRGDAARGAAGGAANRGKHQRTRS